MVKVTKGNPANLDTLAERLKIYIYFLFCQKYIWQHQGDSYKQNHDSSDVLDIQTRVYILTLLFSLAIPLYVRYQEYSRRLQR